MLMKKNGKPKILIVDDRPENLLSMELIFENEPCDIVKAFSGNEALAHVMAHDFALVLLDVQMPGMDGFETAELMRGNRKTRNIPIIFVTAINKEKQNIFKGYGAGAVDYMIKPLDPNILKSKANIFLKLYRQKANLKNIALKLKKTVTQLKQSKVELKLTHQKQLQIKDQFVSNVSHELRTPISVIHQFVTILLDGIAGDLNPEQDEYLDIVLRNLGQLNTMIDDLLDATRAETGRLSVKPQPTLMSELIAETVKSLIKTAAAKEISISVENHGDLPFVHADPNRVRQILINLIENGIKFTPQNGTITVSVRVSSEEPHSLCVAVTDTGCGISPEEKETIFEYLYQVENTIVASRKGLGIGLYICKELVSRHGGRIWVESRSGIGSTFFFTLPIYSLAGALSPIFINKNPENKSVALIAVKIFHTKKNILTKLDERALLEVSNILEKCIYPNKDMLLPGTKDIKSGEIFFIVALTDRKGAEVLVTRIKEQLASCETIQNGRFDSTVSFTIVDITQSMKNMPVEQLVEDMSNRIKVLIKKQVSVHP